ncbi:MAG: glycogen synthase [Patescibacteria group bacterium]|nr:glycogen synthase [Patescibacteria group bacterium]
MDINPTKIIGANIFKKKRALKILFVASEAGPFVKVGGLGEVMYSLPRALRALGHDARVMIPKYATIETDKFSLKLEFSNLKIMPETNDPNGLFVSNVFRYEEKSGETIAYFLENMEYYEKRANAYGYTDDAIRWALLSKGTLEFLKKSKWIPDIIVACDWQAGLLPNYLRTEYSKEPLFSKIAMVFSIHNLSYQGMFDHHLVTQADYDAGHEEIPTFDNPRLLKLNFMRRGIMYADAINTVSPTYAQEITTPEYGEMLDGLLIERRSRLFGILNGIDYDYYNPETDSQLDHKYSDSTLYKRSKNKNFLRKRFGLEQKENTPLLAIVSRLTDQKGFGLLFDTARSLLKNFNMQLIILGAGDSSFINFFQELAKEYPKDVAGHFIYDESLPRLILGSADILLMPSKFEPSGLTQMEAMRYGALPLVRKTGGLADTVTDYEPVKQKSTGFVFEPFDSYVFYGTVIRALETFKYPQVWERIQKRAMKEDFSWSSSAKEYLKLFEKAIFFHTEEPYIYWENNKK